MKLMAIAVSLAALLTTTATHSTEVALPPFYKNVGSIKREGPLGKVVAKEKVATSIPGAEAWRIAYVSTDVRDRRTISTGLVIAPKGKPPKGGRPVVSWAHGTTGTAQSCGPSQVLDPAQDLNEYFLIGGTSWTDFGIPAASEFIKLGYVLVATDYQGLGGGGSKHQYVIASTQARETIDAVRAVGSMGLTGSNKKTVIYGWSQGGGAVIAATNMPEYINQKKTAFDGVEVIGAVALAPYAFSTLIPADARGDEAASAKVIQGMTEQFSDSVFNFAHLSMSLWAMDGTFPELKMTDLFTEQGAKTLNEVFSKKCMHAGADTISFNLGATYKSTMKPQPTNAKAWVNAMLEGSVKDGKPIAPVVIYWGNKDVTNPPIMGEIYQKQKCAVGGNVQRVELPGQSHFTTPPVSQPLYTQWVKDRFDGKPVGDGCKM